MRKNALVSRITEMEGRFDGVSRRLDALEEALTGLEALNEDIEALEGYMSSGQWLKDFEADEAGKVPQDVKRGVLSEDGLYDLLERVRSLREQVPSLRSE